MIVIRTVVDLASATIKFVIDLASLAPPYRKLKDLLLNACQGRQSRDKLQYCVTSIWSFMPVSFRELHGNGDSGNTAVIQLFYSKYYSSSTLIKNGQLFTLIYMPVGLV